MIISSLSHKGVLNCKYLIKEMHPPALEVCYDCIDSFMVKFLSFQFLLQFHRSKCPAKYSMPHIHISENLHITKQIVCQKGQNKHKAITQSAVKVEKQYITW